MSQHKLIDEFTNLPVCRQRKYQLRKMKARKCVLCGGKLQTKTMCAKCAPKHRKFQREYARARYKWKPKRVGKVGRPLKDTVK